MAENQVNPLFNIHEKYKEVIIINPYRFGGSDPDAVAQAARIVADGGTVVDFAYMNLIISTLKSMGLYQYCKLLTDANFGVKKDPSTGAVSKLYDISGNNNDAVQATGVSQPIWSLVNGRGVITYDGVDDWMETSNNIGLVTYFTLKSTINFPGISRSYFQLPQFNPFQFLINPTKKLQIYPGGSSSLSITPLIPHSITVISNNVNTVVLCDNIQYLSVNLSYTSTGKFYLGRYYGGSSSSENFLGQINSSTIFNIALSQSQITQLTNLGL